MKAKKNKNQINSGSIHVNVREVLCRAVETGVSVGWRRAHKHTDIPLAEDVIESITRAVMEEIHNYFEFPNSQLSGEWFIDCPECVHESGEGRVKEECSRCNNTGAIPGR
jgi:hypothetical protein